MSLGDPSAFWDEEKQRTELRIGCHALYGEDYAVLAVLAEIRRLIDTNVELRNHIGAISRTVYAAETRAIAP